MTATLDPRQLSLPCQHRWLLPAPDGRPMLPGKCLYCGQERGFKPWLEDFKPLKAGRGKQIRL